MGEGVLLLADVDDGNRGAIVPSVASAPSRIVALVLGGSSSSRLPLPVGRWSSVLFGMPVAQIVQALEPVEEPRDASRFPVREVHASRSI